MKKTTPTLLILFVLVLFSFKNVGAQQISLFNHYFFNSTLYNPAFTGNKETTNIMLVSKQQWSGFNNSPKLNLLTIDGPIFNKKMGLGAILYSDTKGVNKTLGGNLLYAYHINLNKQSKLSFGLSLRFLSHSIDFSQATVQDISDPTLYQSKQSNTNFDGNIGLAYQWKNLELGVALDQLLKTKSSFISELGNDVSYTPAYHYINSLKYTFILNKEKQLLLAPQALVRYVPNAPLQYEINTNVYFKNTFWVGGAYKNDYAIAVNAGVNLFKKISVGYSYDVITSDIGQYSGISHELMLNYKFGKKEKKEKIEEEETPVVQEIPKEEEEKDTAKVEREVKEAEVIILRAPAKEFKDENGNTSTAGVYVIVGSFKENEYAKKYTAKIAGKGYKKTDRFYSEKRGYNYVYMFKEVSLKAAMKKIEQARKDGSKDAWIIILND